MAFLKVYSGGEERTVFLGGDPVILGRGDDTQVLLKDLKASRHHCVIEPCGGDRWRVRDLDSGNGTKVNGERVLSRVLEPEDVVQVGDARIVYGGEAAAVVQPRKAAEPLPAPPPERPRRRQRSSSAALLVVAVLAIAGGGLAIFWSGLGGEKSDPKERAAYRAVVGARSDREIVELAEAYRLQFHGAAHAAEVARLADEARGRIGSDQEVRPPLYDPTPELEGRSTVRAIEHLEKMLREAPEAQRPGIRKTLTDFRDRLARERQQLFDAVRAEFDGFLAKGEYAQARELWFFLRGEEAWEPIPESYASRIVDAMMALENAASIQRDRIFDEVGQLEAERRFEEAKELLLKARPDFAGTSVARSFEERLEFLDKALGSASTGEPTRPRTTVRVDVEKQMEAILGGLRQRDFRGTATRLRGLAEQVKGERGYPEVDARAGEIEAAAALHDAVAAALAAGDVPSTQIRKRWRVLEGGALGLKVRTKGSDLDYPWLEVPPELYLALLERRVGEMEHGPLGLAVIAHAIGGPDDVAAAVAAAYDKEDAARVDAFVAARIKAEAVPDGGYVVHAGEILSKKEHLRRVEEALIARYQEQLDQAFAAIRADKTWSRLEKLKKKKDALDEARDYALALIFDEKAYFYPYRGTGREGEYNKVQQEVDRRVKAVRELWEDRTSVSVRASSELQRALKLFDEAATELGKRLVEVEEKTDEVAFLRSYLGAKLDIRTLYRTPEEKELLDYSREVMEYNPTVEGDIKDNERKQVEVTNEYRLMFGRWPVRIVEKLVLSSRGHCEEMSRLGYFGHFSPTPGRRTPYDRMKLQGYTYGASENCVAGTTDPQGSHDRWCHSSGHHRNILMPPWTEMGTGAAGSFMTQNFGQAPKWSKDDARKPVTYTPADDYDDEEDPDGDTTIEEEDYDYEDDEEG